MSTDLIVSDAQQAFERSRPEANSILQIAEGLKIETDEDYQRASEYGIEWKTKLKVLEEAFEPPRSAAKRAHEAICTLEKQATQKFKDSLHIVKGKMVLHIQKKEREQREEQARLAQEAKIQAAVEAEQDGDGEKSERILEGSEVVAVPVAPVIKPTAEGVSTRKIWTFQVHDAEKINRQFLAPDMVKIGKTVRAMEKEAEQLVGGIAVSQSVEIAMRAARG